MDRKLAITVVMIYQCELVKLSRFDMDSKGSIDDKKLQ